MFYRIIIVVTLAFAPQAFAKRSLWTRACDLFLNRHPVETEDMHRAKLALEDEVYRNNKVAPADQMTVEIKELDYLEEAILGVEILPHLSAAYKVKAPIDMRLIANPELLKSDWSDGSSAMSATPMLLLYFDNLLVTLPGGKKSTVQALLEEKVAELSAENPSYKLKTHSSDLGSFHGPKVQNEFSARKYFWISGNLTNGNVKRILLLAFDHAYESLIQDPRYAEKVERH